MTAIISKPAQNRLDSCALARPKWAKIRKPRRKHTRGTLRIDILVADAAVRVENAQQNGQIRGNTKLLGKYRLKIRVSALLRTHQACPNRSARQCRGRRVPRPSVLLPPTVALCSGRWGRNVPPSSPHAAGWPAVSNAALASRGCTRGCRAGRRAWPPSTSQ